jgi:GTP-binding protein HflX
MEKKSINHLPAKGGDIVKGPVSTYPELERAILVGVSRKGQQQTWNLNDSLQELGTLATGAGAVVVDAITQQLEHPTSRYLGKGKLNELHELGRKLGCTVAVFDDELSPTQQTNLEEALVGIKIIDRTALILDTFARQARTKEGRLQVELAQHQYLLPRLAGQWSHLERLGGGIGTRGPGETQLETDRRIVRKKIQRLKSDLEDVRKHRHIHRRRRQRSGVPIISLVGYTNVGKSTILNTLSGSNVTLAEDRPFSTLDPVTRRSILPNGREILITDTVGFIHKLPTTLVAAFRATLEELEDADLLLNVIDISHPNACEQSQVVEDTLKSLQLSSKPRILVMNKIDQLNHAPDMLETVVPGFTKLSESSVLISAKKGWGIDTLRNSIQEHLVANP